jgi:hypothetical protein
MVGEGMVQGGTVKVTMKKVKANATSGGDTPAQELSFDIKKKGRTNLKKKPVTKTVTKKKQAVAA